MQVIPNAQSSVSLLISLCAFSFLLTIRRQELRELRLLQKEEQRAQQQLSNKLLQQREQMYRRFEQEMTVRFSAFSPLSVLQSSHSESV